MKTFKNLFLILLLLGSMYLYYVNIYRDICSKGVEYSLGAFDSDFGLTREQFLSVIRDAETPWEKFSGKNIFKYNPEADFKINLIFGEQQERLYSESNLRDNLDSKERLLKTQKSRYQYALSEYKKASSKYKKDSSSYSTQVDYWNTKGGAPEKEFKALESRKVALDRDFQKVKNLEKKVNSFAQESSSDVTSYNDDVEKYNKLFSETKEFDAGNTDGTEINIYSYKDAQELKSVISHEFGHVLGIDHLSQTSSIMYYLLNDENKSGKISEQDKTALSDICRL